MGINLFSKSLSSWREFAIFDGETDMHCKQSQPLMTCILYPMTSSRAGRLPWSFYEIWNESSLTTLNKKDTADLKINEIMNCRPICIGEAIKKEITKALYRPYMNKIIAGS